MVRTQELLTSDAPVVAVLGCSFPAFFHAITPGQLVAGLKSLGFLEVHEGAYGARMIASSYREILSNAELPVISSHCPAVVDLIERHYPKLLPNLMGIVSPMIAMGRFIKTVLGADTNVVYISTCIAAKFEIQSAESAGAIDVVLTYQEIDKLLKSEKRSFQQFPVLEKYATELDALKSQISFATSESLPVQKPNTTTIQERMETYIRLLFNISMYIDIPKKKDFYGFEWKGNLRKEPFKIRDFYYEIAGVFYNLAVVYFNQAFGILRNGKQDELPIALKYLRTALWSFNESHKAVRKTSLNGTPVP